MHFPLIGDNLKSVGNCGQVRRRFEKMIGKNQSSNFYVWSHIHGQSYSKRLITFLPFLNKAGCPHMSF